MKKPISDKKLLAIKSRAKWIIRLDKKFQWREAINICNYSVFEDGVNLVPRLVDEIIRLREELKNEGCSES